MWKLLWFLMKWLVWWLKGVMIWLWYLVMFCCVWLWVNVCSWLILYWFLIGKCLICVWLKVIGLMLVVKFMVYFINGGWICWCIILKFFWCCWIVGKWFLLSKICWMVRVIKVVFRFMMVLFILWMLCCLLKLFSCSWVLVICINLLKNSIRWCWKCCVFNIVWFIVIGMILLCKWVILKMRVWLFLVFGFIRLMFWKLKVSLLLLFFWRRVLLVGLILLCCIVKWNIWFVFINGWIGY